MKFPSLSGIFTGYLQSWMRFPLSMLATHLGTIISIVLINYHFDHDRAELFGRWLMTLALANPLFIAIRAYSESHNVEQKWGFSALNVAGIGLLYLFFRYLTVDIDHNGWLIYTFAGLLAVVHILVAIAPFLRKHREVDIWEYNRQLFGSILTGMFYGFILWGGLSLAILAVDNLFDAHIHHDIYPKWFILVAGIFLTTFFLSNFPKDYVFEAEEMRFNKVYLNTCRFLLIPIVMVYLAILYAYSGKIALTWSLPHGWISSLIISFSIVGILTWLLNYLLPLYYPKAPITAFSKWYFLALLPMVFLLFIGVGKRIGDYGITEERYFVAHTGIWLLLISIYFSLRRSDNRKLLVLPFSLMVFILFAIFGPFNANKVSVRNQMGRLEEIFQRNNMIKEGKLQPATTALPVKDAERIGSVLSFLERREKLFLLHDRVGADYYDFVKAQNTRSGFTPPADDKVTSYGLTSFLNINIDLNQLDRNRYFYYSASAEQMQGKQDIKGFDYLFPVQYYNGWEDLPIVSYPAMRSSNNSVYLYWSATETDSLSLLPHADRLRMVLPDQYSNTLTDSLRVINHTGKYGNLRLYMNNFNFEILEETNSYQLSNLDGVLVARRK